MQDDLLCATLSMGAQLTAVKGAFELKHLKKKESLLAAWICVQ